MMTSELIKILQESMEMNGDMEVGICTDATLYGDVEVNVTDYFFWIEGYKGVYV